MKPWISIVGAGLGALYATACTATPDEGSMGESLSATQGSGGMTPDASSSGGTGGEGTGSTSVATADDSSDSSGGTSSTGDPFPETTGDTDTGLDDACAPVDPLAVPPCTLVAPPDSFDAVTEWEWTGEEGSDNAFIMPLVANFTDDNDDGEIDLCDTPDVLITVCGGNPFLTGNMVLFDGASGQEHVRFGDDLIPCASTPAIGDIDGDGLVEIVTTTIEFTDEGPRGHVTAFENDGTLKWVGPIFDEWGGVPYALADLDEDGSIEILVARHVFSAEGELLFSTDMPMPQTPVPTAADLDGEPGLEFIMGSSAVHADGTPYFTNDEVDPGMPQIGQLDNDPQPEILLTTQNGIAVLEHDGTTKFSELRPTGDPVGINNWLRPAAIHDMDGDGGADFALSSAETYATYRADGSIIWQAMVDDASGAAGGTAFDFLGDGTAEAMYGDENNMFVFSGDGTPLVSDARASRTGIEYPVVADVDNDGSAEIIVVSNNNVTKGIPTLRVLGDVDDRWIGTRRIWNQHAYHVTNVNEDGSIPQTQARSWETLNTFRTNVQLENGVVCEPEG